MLNKMNKCIINACIEPIYYIHLEQTNLSVHTRLFNIFIDLQRPNILIM